MEAFPNRLSIADRPIGGFPRRVVLRASTVVVGATAKGKLVPDSPVALPQTGNALRDFLEKASGWGGFTVFASGKRNRSVNTLLASKPGLVSISWRKL